VFLERRICYRIERSAWKWASASGICFINCWYKRNVLWFLWLSRM